MRSRWGVVVMVLAGCPARPRPAPPIAEPPPVVSTGPAAPLAAWFGAWNEDTGAFDRISKFEKVEGQTFGWRIKTRCTGPVRFRETMKLPAPGDWGFTADEMPGTTISSDGTTTVTVDYAACKQGWIEHVWTVAAEDPAGTYVITVELDGYATQTFRPRFIAP